MEKNKEAVGKSYSDFYGNKKVDASKINFVKNNNHSVRPEKGRSKISCISRGKNAKIQINKKFGFYGNEVKPFLKHACGRCEIKSRPPLVFNADSVNSFPEGIQVESGHDLNGNISVSTCAAFCNFTSPVSDISTLNKVLHYQSNQHYELSFSGSSKYKQRTAFSEQKSFSSKITLSNNPFATNRFYSSLSNSRIKYRSSKGISQNVTFPEPYFKTLSRPSHENYNVNGKYNKYIALPDACMNNESAKLTDLPVFENPNSNKDFSMTCKVDYFAEQLQVKKQRNYSSKKWNNLPITSEFGESSTTNIDETDKMLFPALPSNNHNQHGKLNSSYTSTPPSDQSVENSDLEITHALSGTNIALNASTISSTVSSTIPQASYADVIRMSTTCSGVQGCEAFDNKIPEQNSLLLESPISEKLSKEENPQTSSSDWVISRLSQLDANLLEPLGASVTLTQCHQNGQNFVAPRPIVVSLEKPSFYNSSLQACKNVLSTHPSNCTFPPIDKRIMENDSSLDDCLSSLEKNSVDSSLLPGSTNRSSVSSDFATSMTDTQMTSMKTDSVYSSPSSVSSFGDAFKPTEHRDLHIDSLLKKEPPVIIMNYYSPPGSMSDICFGIEYEEMVKLCSDIHIEESDPLAVQDIEDPLPDESIRIDSSQKTSISLITENVLPSASSEIETINKCINLKGKTLFWKDLDVKYNKENHLELTEYLCSVWIDIGKELEEEKGTSYVIGSIHRFQEE